MRMLVFGASGKTGREIVKLALEKGHEVTAFVRDPGKLMIAHTRLRAMRGDVGDRAAIEAAMPGHDVVFSALGVGKPLSPDPVVVEGIRGIVATMASMGPRRLVYLSFIGTRDSRDAAGPILRFASAVPLRHEVADHEKKEELVRGSGLDWTIVKPPKLRDGPARGYQSGADIRTPTLFPMMSRADVAAFMVSEAEQPAWPRMAVRMMPR